MVIKSIVNINFLSIFKIKNINFFHSGIIIRYYRLRSHNMSPLVLCQIPTIAKTLFVKFGSVDSFVEFSWLTREKL